MATLTDSAVWPPEPMRTARLVVRAPAERDRGGLIRTLTSASSRRHLGGPVAEAAAEAATRGPYGCTPGSFVAVLATTGAVVGTIGLERRDRGRPGHLRDGDELEISFVLLPEHWGRGLAAEAVGAVLDWAWRELPDDHVVAVTQVANEAARQLLERLGFAETSRFDEFGARQSLWVADRGH